ncbi:MAG: hypothetical protein R3E08_11670 [Thiotrichaceae bacterium]
MTNDPIATLDLLENQPPSRPAEEVLKIYLIEYNNLKNEQIQRIGFRDNLLYAMLVAFGGVCSYVLSNDNYLNVLLILPSLCFILGWTYMVNDEKISAIGKYLRSDMRQKMSQLTHAPVETLLSWEVVHRSDAKRKSRKRLQFAVDLLSFVGTGCLAIMIFAVKVDCEFPPLILLAVGIDSVLLLILSFLIWQYTDFKVGSA